MISIRENTLRAIRFERPDFIPMKFCINPSCWQNYPQELLFDLMESHKLLFPDFKRPEGKFIPKLHMKERKNSPYTDDWGCLWQTAEDGITGVVTKHPINDWEDFSSYKSPDPNKCTGIGEINWDNAASEIKNAKEKGMPAVGELRHGHTFLQLCDIRGYENLIFDMVDERSELMELINMIEEFNLAIVKKYLAADVDIFMYPEDLGMQRCPMLSPAHFKKYIKPSYQRLMAPAREQGVIIHMHSDGYLHELIDDIIDGGVQVMNLQDLVNGIDWIATKLSGKVCVELDIDRQDITPRGTPKEIDALIREEVEKIGSREGGLMMIYGLYPGVPAENIKALMDAMERYSFYYA